MITGFGANNLLHNFTPLRPQDGDRRHSDSRIIHSGYDVNVCVRETRSHPGHCEEAADGLGDDQRGSSASHRHIQQIPLIVCKLS